MNLPTTRRILEPGLFILLLGSMASQATELPAAHEASPTIYQVLTENEHVLVLRMTLAPGQSDALHQHNAETVYFQHGGSLRIEPYMDATVSDPVTATVPDGHVMWHDAWAHRVTNVGDSTVVAIIIEQKP